MCCFDERLPKNRWKPSCRGRNRRGQSLVEFAVVSLVVYMLLAAILTFGQILYSSQGLQQAVDVAARELSRTPLPANKTFSQALADSGVQSKIFDERYLVLSIDTGSNPMTFNGGHPIGDFPLVIQQLLPLMIYETGLTEVQANPLGGIQPIQYFPGPSSQIGGYLRYPGAVFMDPNGPDTTMTPPTSGFLVRIPVVSVPAYPAPATESIINWVSVLEEINSTANVQNNLSGFQVSSPERGVVALRINYPYQSASMSGFQPPADPTSPPGPPDNPVIPIPSDDAIPVTSPPQGVGNPVVSAWVFGASSGLYGLGTQAAWVKVIRPYRSLISAQAIYRREVFSSQ